MDNVSTKPGIVIKIVKMEAMKKIAVSFVLFVISAILYSSDKSHCGRTHSSLAADLWFDDGYNVMSVVWKENCREDW